MLGRLGKTAFPRSVRARVCVCVCETLTKDARYVKHGDSSAVW